MKERHDMNCEGDGSYGTDNQRGLIFESLALQPSLV